MIIKFDHISYSCSDMKHTQDIISSYYLKFEESNLENIPCKKALLKQKNPLHNIYMYYAKGDDIPIEITQYTNIKGRNETMKISSRKIEWSVKNLEKAEQFLLCLGANKCKGEAYTYSLMAVLEKEPLMIYLKKDENAVAPGYLDVEGWSSIGLIVDNVQNEAEKFKRNGFFVTESSPIMVNSKKLNIVFVRGFNGEIIELISLEKGEKR